MFDNFFKHIDIDPMNANILNGNAEDLVKECEEYERKIQAAGGIELFIGNDVHSHNVLTVKLFGLNQLVFVFSIFIFRFESIDQLMQYSGVGGGVWTVEGGVNKVDYMTSDLK